MDEQSPGFKWHRERYRIIEEMGQGAYGTVLKAYDTQTHEVVALKTVQRFHQSDGLPLSFYREERYLQTFQSEDNIVKILSTERTSKQTICLVLEFCETDLAKQLQIQSHMTVGQIKNLMFQLLKGLNALHSQNIVHRDIKPSNLLIKNGRTLKIADFGLARNVSDRMTNRVSSLAYRAPELLFGSSKYSTSVDIWSTAIVFYELLTGEKLFPLPCGSDLSQLDAIFKITGTPESCDSLSQLPQWRLTSLLHKYPRKLEELLRTKIPYELSKAIPMLESMLQIDPLLRPSAEMLLQSPFFSQMEAFIPLPLPEIPDVNCEISSPRSPLIRPNQILLEV